MKISYKSVTGEVTAVEATADIGEFITASRRAEDSADRKERRHCISLDGIQYEGNEFGSPDPTEKLFNDTDERDAKIKTALSHLTDTQQRRLIQHFLGGLSEREIARREGRDYKSVHESIVAAKKKFKKYYR